MKFGKSLMSLGIVSALLGSTVVGVGAAESGKVKAVEIKKPSFEVTGKYAIKKPTGELFGEKLYGGSFITGKAFKHDTVVGTVRFGNSVKNTSFAMGPTHFFGGIGLKANTQYVIKAGELGTGKLGEVVSPSKKLVGKTLKFSKRGNYYVIQMSGRALKFEESDRVLATDRYLIREDLIPVKKAPEVKPIPNKVEKGIPKPGPIKRLSISKNSTVVASDRVELSGKTKKAPVVKPKIQKPRKFKGIEKPIPVVPVKEI